MFRFQTGDKNTQYLEPKCIRCSLNLIYSKTDAYRKQEHGDRTRFLRPTDPLRVHVCQSVQQRAHLKVKNMDKPDLNECPGDSPGGDSPPSVPR
jgi:hypothetical protein